MMKYPRSGSEENVITGTQWGEEKPEGFLQCSLRGNKETLNGV